jgi:hypothetical protein
MFAGWSSQDLITLAVVWLVLCGVVAFIAPMRGKSPVGAFLISLLASPLIGFLAVVLARPESQAPEAVAGAARRSNSLIWIIGFFCRCERDRLRRPEAMTASP